MYTFLHLCTLLYICVHFYTSMYTLTHLCTLLHFYVHFYTSMYTFIHLRTLLYIFVHSYMSVFTELHIQQHECSSITLSLLHLVSQNFLFTGPVPSLKDNKACLINIVPSPPSLNPHPATHPLSKLLKSYPPS